MFCIRSFIVVAALALTACVTNPKEPAPTTPASATLVGMPAAAYAPAPQYSFLPSPVGEQERAVLARLENEFQVLDGLIAQAQAVASPDTQPRFRYDWLRRDLERVRHGVREHLQDPGNQPRRFAPLRGDYRQ